MLFNDSTSQEYAMCDDDLEELKNVSNSKDEIIEEEVVRKLQRCINELKVQLSSKSRTAKLWIQYMDYIEILRQFIRAARTGDW